jgi:Cdc6-like AAA superfamily ATPase
MCARARSDRSTNTNPTPGASFTITRFSCSNLREMPSQYPIHHDVRNRRSPAGIVRNANISAA